MSRIRKLICRVLGHDWDENYIPSIMRLVEETGAPIYVPGGGKSKPCKRCGRWTWVG